VIREALSAVARNEAIGPLLSRTPVARDVVKRVVGGESTDDALAVAQDLADRGFMVSLERAAPRVETEEQAAELTEECTRLVAGIADAGLGGVCEIAVFPEALHVADRPDAAWGRLQQIVRTASDRGVAVMVGSGPDPDRTLTLFEELAAEGLETGITIASAHRRAEADCRSLADRRVRLVKGGRRGDPSDLQQPIEIDKAYIRCAKHLLRGAGEPSFATHDPRLLEMVTAIARKYERPLHSYEFAFFLGRQEGAQEQLLADGERVRIYVPYGPQWFERLVGGLAEQSSTIGGALLSLLPR
jgi:proline dehydrogenase